MVGILVDVTRCIGCEKCVAACIKENNLDPQKADLDKALAKDGLSENRLTTVNRLSSERFAKKSCMHCLDPSCVSACLVGGITRSENGAVVYDPDKCIGCRYCMIACPFTVPRYEWSNTVPFMKKCELCEDRLSDNQLPACVEACPQSAIVYGDRAELLQKAKKQISEQPGKYIQHIWGEHEFGGTAVMYISDVNLAELGWPGENHDKAIPEMNKPVVHATPVIAGSVLTCVAGINWIVQRRMKLNHEKVESGQNNGGGSNE